MRYKLASDVEVELLLDNMSLLNGAPVWNLSDWSLWAGGSKNGYELEDMASSSWGSSSWLWSTVDTILFSKESKKLRALAVKIPELITIKEENIFKADKHEHDIGNLVLCNSENFKLGQCRSSVYLKKCDQLLFFSVDNLNSIKYDYSLEVTKDLFILFNKILLCLPGTRHSSPWDYTSSIEQESVL